MKKLILLILVLIPQFIFAQPLQSWVARYVGPNHYQDNPRAMTSDSEGNIYVTGTTDLGQLGVPPYPFPTNVVTIKYNSSGVQQWVVTYCSSGVPATSYDYVGQIALDNTGNVYIAGSSLRANATIRDMFIIKYNPDGIQQWIKKIEGNSTTSYGAGSFFMKNSEFYLTCSHANVSAGINGTRFLKYNFSGELLWSANTDSGYGKTRMDQDGNFYIVSRDIMKFNSQGVMLWKNSFDYQGYLAEEVSDFGIDHGGNIYVTGIYNNNPASNRDYLTIKYNSLTGIKEWTRMYNGPFNHKDRAYCIAVDSIGNSYVSGESVGADTSYDCTTIKYSANGDIVWLRRYSYAPGSSYDESGYRLYLDGKGSLYIGGDSYAYGIDYYLMLRYSTEGDLEYPLRYKGPNSTNYFREFLIRDNGDIIVTGQSDSADINIVTVKYSNIVGVTPNGNTNPLNYKLTQNFPNPFNPVTKIVYEIPFQDLISLKVYDALGKEIETLVNEQQNAGNYSVVFDASSKPSGIYYYRLVSGNYSETKKMILIK